MLELNICYSLDSQYAEQLAVSMSSILNNSDEDENINFYILDGGLSNEDKTNINSLKKIKNFSIEYININKEDFNCCPLLKEKDEKYSSYHVTLPTYFRFKLPTLLNDLDKVLYIDCDIIARTSLKELFKENLNNKALAMVLDAESKKEAKRLGLKKYYNAGVMLINLDFWRKNNVEESLFNYAKNNSDKILWQDQDIVNIVLEDKIKSISEKWNFQYFLYEKIDVKALSDSSIIHLAGRFKPWLIPFEHPIYDYYYYYLSFTPWKNKIIQYKQMSSLKYLKNNVGGSETNILLAATDEDLQKVYKEITNSYRFTEESCKLLDAKFDILQKEFSDFKFSDFDNSISKVYEEISKNYDYTNELNKNVNEVVSSTKEETQGKINQSKEEITQQTDEKISKVYEEISKNYDYTNELNKNVNEMVSSNNSEIQGLLNKSIETISELHDEKITKIYEELSKNYDYTNELNKNIREKVDENKEESQKIINDLRYEVTINTDEKISKVYEEISKNYDYTNELNTSSKNLINETKSEVEGFVNKSLETISELHDEKISKVYEEISKNYDYTNELNKNVNEIVSSTKEETQEKINQSKEKITQQTDEKISKVYEEISKNYDYTNELNKNVNEIVSSTKEEITQQTDEKISKVYEEISKNYDYTNELNKNVNEIVSSTKEETQGKINQSKEEITQQTDEKISKVYEEISKNYNYTNELNNNVNEKINQNREETQKTVDIIKQNVYSFINEKNAGLYNVLSEYQSLLEGKINQGNNEQYQKSLEIEYKINNIKENKTDKKEFDSMTSIIKNKIENIEEIYKSDLEKLRNNFEDELNNQRIKYERKLIEMENILKSLDEKYEAKRISLFQRIRNKIKREK